MTIALPPSGLSAPVRVMIVDDSGIIRSIIEKFLKADPMIQVVGFAANGEEAVNSILMCRPDIVILDIEMPVMDGITALPLLLAKKPDTNVVICSTLSHRGAEVSLKATSLGASDYILKPSGASNIRDSNDFQDSLLTIVRNLGQKRHLSVKAGSSTVTLRKDGNRDFRPEILAIGSSTGGPAALIDVLKRLASCPLPIVITQHMPKTFTTVLASHLQANTGLTCCEATHGMTLKPGQVHIAPGGYHMQFKRVGPSIQVQLDEGPMENFCRPAVDPMLRSLAEIYGGRVLTVILTGMGNDGLLGAQKIVAAGGRVIAQDEATSVVWGMPGAVAKDGLCAAVLPLPKISEYISQTLVSLQRP